MFIKKKSKFILVYLLSLIIIFILLAKNVPGFKGNIDQELRIITKTPIILDPTQSLNSNLSNVYNSITNLLKKKKFDEIKININFENYDILKKDRSKALKEGMLLNPKVVNIDLEFKGKEYKASARLKGDFNDHRNYAKQWSLKINLKNSESILGMSEFSLVNHKSRNFPYNYIISQNLNNMGLHVPKFETFKVKMNGYDWGLMLAEEHFTSEFLELRKLKDNLVFKLSNEEIIKFAHLYLYKDKISKEEFNYLTRWQDKIVTNFHNKSKILKKNDSYEKTRLINYFSLMQNINEKVYFDDSLDDKFLEEYFNIELFAKMFASSLIWGESELHSTNLNNVRFYINPYNLKISPMPADYDFIFKQNMELENIQNMISELPYFYKPLINNKNFQKNYLLALNEFEIKIPEIIHIKDQLCKNFTKICLNLFQNEELISNFERLKNYKLKIFDFQNDSTKFLISTKIDKKEHDNFFRDLINFRAYDNGLITLKNLSPFDIELLSVNKRNGEELKKFFNEELNASNKNISQISFNITDEIIPNEEIEIKFKNKITDKIRYASTIVENSSNITNINTKNINLKKFLNSNISLKKNDLIFNEGNFSINELLILPKNYNLILEAGVKITFSDTGGILLKGGSFKINGTENKPVVLTASDKKWEGIHVIGDNTKSIINYADFFHTSFFSQKNYYLTGGINFYNTDLEIYNSNFLSSDAEDALNIINSKFLIDGCNFIDARSDAIDLDFSHGTISNSKFDNINGDAVDTSGSIVKIKNLEIENIGDKAISAGEKSTITADNIKIKNSKIGIASKDTSKFIGQKIQIKESLLFDLAAFNKKSIYKGGSINLRESFIENKIISQFGSEIKLDKKIIDNQNIDIEYLYQI